MLVGRHVQVEVNCILTFTLSNERSILKGSNFKCQVLLSVLLGLLIPGKISKMYLSHKKKKKKMVVLVILTLNISNAPRILTSLRK